jgi:hypothetical protein
MTTNPITQATHALYVHLDIAAKPRGKTAKLLERIDMAAEAMAAYARELEGEIEDYHPADLQPTVTRDAIIAGCRQRAGVTAATLGEAE